MSFIDLRSDTVTQPTPEMREAMYRAEVGDDVYGDDPTVNRLEAYAAEVAGKEAALFVPSGTFGNQLALFTHCERGQEVIVGENSHIVQHEVGASAVIAGVQLRTFHDDKGRLDAAEIESKIRRERDLHYPDTGLICLENAHSNGMVFPYEDMEQVFALSRKYNLPVHLDGARLFNAAVYLKVTASEIASLCDSVMFCLSKGLCAPVGSILAGTRRFIEKARKKRKLMGGGMRQAGILAAAGLVALEKMRHRVSEDHENALLLATGLASIPGIRVNPRNVHINMVFFDMKDTGIETKKLAQKLYARNIKVNPGEDGVMRLVTHYWVGKKEVAVVVDAIRDILAQEAGERAR